ncbi:MAG TPA: hypothetical protein PKE04_16290 [Clostridia bacterium]|nr:hypothetical protein [Clostridia bacterium]
MLKVRVVLLPSLTLVLLIVLARWNVSIGQIAQFSFLWDALLGIALGVGLYLLPGLSGVRPKMHPNAGLYWVPAFLMALLLCLQYMALVTGNALFDQSGLLVSNGRSCVVEGAGLGYCMAQALRAR